MILFAGCQAYPAHAQQVDPMIPPGLDALSVHPYTGAQLEKAQKGMDAILKNVKRPAYLPEDPVARQKKIDADPDVEPPLAAELAYVQARMAWQQKRLFEARQYLERALTMAPNSEHLLEMLAQLWAAAGNRSRSSSYLEKVVQVDPLNMDLILQLGGFALDQERFDDAIAIFVYVLKYLPDAPEQDPGMAPLVEYYLGAALDREGYVAAAIHAYRRFLTNQVQQMPNNAREARRMDLLKQQQGLLWRQLGDSYCQLQQYDNALDAYRTAVTVGVSNKLDIIRRLVYVCLKIKRSDLAAKSALEALQDQKIDPGVVDLIRFMSDHVSDRQAWIAQVQDYLKKKDADSQAVMLLLDLFSPDVAGQMVTTHLKANPGDEKAIAWLLDHLKLDSSDADMTRAVNVILTAMATKPQKADTYSAMIVSKVTDQARLQKQVKQLPEDAKTKALRLLLLAQSTARTGDIKQSQKLLEDAVAADDQLIVARLRLAILHMSLKEFGQADKILESIKDPSDPRVVTIRVRLLIAADRLDDALTVMNHALQLRPDDVNLVLQKAQLQLRMNKAVLAERTLLDALNVNPMAEQIYDALFEMYDQGAVPDSMEQYKRLMMRVLKTIPNSRVARIRFAEALAVSSNDAERDRAEKLYLQLLDENPKDYRALSQLLEFYRRSQLNDKAQKILDQRLDAAPDDRTLMLLAQTHYQQTGQLARSADLLEKFWTRPNLDDNTGLTVLTMLASDYVKLNRLQDVNKLFNEAIKRYPKHEANLMFAWSQHMSKLGQEPRSEKIMEQLLAKHPDHAPANNGLGYSWANRGEKLQRAHKMIERALKNDPNNAAYLDSLGWVLYKLGEYDKAVEQLQNAQTQLGGDYPVILDHLGDALYRKGDKDKAIAAWRRAQQRMNQPDADPDIDPEIKGLDGRLKAKITAASQQKEPPVADVNVPK